MKRIDSGQSDVVDVAATTLGRGGVIVLPTDTIYGFSAALNDRDACDSILALKGSREARRFICLADSIAMVDAYVDGWGSSSRADLAAMWPAPLTVVLPAGARCPRWVGDTVAFRVPDNDLVRRVVAALGQPIVSTSVNRSGEPPINDIDVIENLFGEKVGLAIVRSESTASGMASTVVDVTVSPARVLRRGSYAWPTKGKPSN
jgi:L-threonylcarbamoyladenylate synthase